MLKQNAQNELLEKEAFELGDTLTQAYVFFRGGTP